MVLVRSDDFSLAIPDHRRTVISARAAPEQHSEDESKSPDGSEDPSRGSDLEITDQVVPVTNRQREDQADGYQEQAGSYAHVSLLLVLAVLPTSAAPFSATTGKKRWS